MGLSCTANEKVQCTTILENSVANLKKLIIIQITQEFYSSIYPKALKIIVHKNFIHNSQKMKTSQILISGWVDKHIVAYTVVFYYSSKEYIYHMTANIWNSRKGKMKSPGTQTLCWKWEDCLEEAPDNFLGWWKCVSWLQWWLYQCIHMSHAIIVYSSNGCILLHINHIQKSWFFINEFKSIHFLIFPN